MWPALIYSFLLYSDIMLRKNFCTSRECTNIIHTDIEALETDVVILDLNATDTVSLTCSDYIASRPPPNTFIWKADNITLGNSDSLTLNEKELFENLKKGVATVTCVSSNGVGEFRNNISNA